MSNDYFQFKRFVVHQDRCAMKVGTDGTILGAWAHVPDILFPSSRILDIGTGTGLIAIMMAQRFPNSLLTGIDIDASAVTQATENASASPFADRIQMKHCSLQNLVSDYKYDAIVCNPPYFTNSLKCPDEKRSIARHDSSLSYNELMANSFRLLNDNGEISVIIPSDNKNDMDFAASVTGFYAKRVCTVKTTCRKPAKRVLLSYMRTYSAQIDVSEIIIGDDNYNNMLRDFYLYI